METKSVEALFRTYIFACMWSVDNKVTTLNVSGVIIFVASGEHKLWVDIRKLARYFCKITDEKRNLIR